MTFILLLLMAVLVFHVPVKGSFTALSLGMLVYVFATYGFGQFVSTFSRTQVGAVFTAVVLAVIPTLNFSGLLVPVSSLTGQGRLIGLMFPPARFSRSASARLPKDAAFPTFGSIRWSLRRSRWAISSPRTSCCRSRSPEMAEGEAAKAPKQPTMRNTIKAKRPGNNRFGKLRVHLANIYRLIIKELRGIGADPVMLAVVAYTFTIAIYAVATGASTEATNLSVGVVDEDQSDLSRRIADGLTPPTFKPAVQIAAKEIGPAMDSERFVFVIEIPPRFEADILAGRQPSVQINVDATAIAQAFNGMTYIQNVIMNYVTEFASGREGSVVTPVKMVARAKFNPNLKSSWFSSVMGVINNLTMVTMILTGAALIREREQGTVEHLLVMPVVPAEITLAKMLANGMVILGAAGLSLMFVVLWWLQVPVAGSVLLFLGGSCFYVFAIGALAILLGTIASTMGQFGLLAIPVLLVMMLLSGGTAPGKRANLAAIPHEGDEPDAAFRDFRSGCALSQSGPFHCVAGGFGHGGHRQCLFWLCLVRLPAASFSAAEPGGPARTLVVQFKRLGLRKVQIARGKTTSYGGYQALDSDH